MEITANAIQTVTASNNVLFTATPIPGNCSIIHREGSGLVTLRGLTQQCRARFRVSFNGNIAVPTGQTVGPISLAIAAGGEPIASNIMTATPAAVEQYFNISSTVFIDVPAGCCTQISIQNDSTIPVNIQNANLIVERVAQMMEKFIKIQEFLTKQVCKNMECASMKELGEAIDMMKDMSEVIYYYTIVEAMQHDSASNSDWDNTGK